MTLWAGSRACGCRLPLLFCFMCLATVSLFFVLLPISFPLTLESRLTLLSVISPGGAGNVKFYSDVTDLGSKSNTDKLKPAKTQRFVASNVPAKRLQSTISPGQKPSPKTNTASELSKNQKTGATSELSKNQSLSGSALSVKGRKPDTKPSSEKVREVKAVKSVPGVNAKGSSHPVKTSSKSSASDTGSSDIVPGNLTEEVQLEDAPCDRTLRFSKVALPVTALASVQGSGNTWMRHLVQRLTGIFTGSIYGRKGDPELWQQGYYGEGIYNGSVVVVKTHGLPETRYHFRRAIVIVRNPFDAMFADFNRRASGSHTGIAPARAYVQHWDSFSKTFADRWAKFYTGWLKFTGPVLYVCFDDLVRDLPAQLDRIAKFLKHPSLALNTSCALEDPRGGTLRNASGTQQQQQQHQQHKFTTGASFNKTDVIFPEVVKVTNRNIQLVQDKLRHKLPDLSKAVSSWKRSEKGLRGLVWKPLPKSLN